MSRLTALVALTAALASCGLADEEISRGRETFTIIGINPPKHFRIDVQDSEGRVYRSVGVSKHCNRWREVPIGRQVELEVASYRGSDAQIYRRVWARASEVCPGY